jgi:hypothetical protein
VRIMRSISIACCTCELMVPRPNHVWCAVLQLAAWDCREMRLKPLSDAYAVDTVKPALFQHCCAHLIDAAHHALHVCHTCRSTRAALAQLLQLTPHIWGRGLQQR